MSNLWIDDALWAGERIRDRLKSQVPALREVLCVDEFDPKDSVPKQLPCGLVLCAALRPTDSSTGRTKVLVNADWLVVLAVRSARRPADSNSSELGPLISATVRALQAHELDTARLLTWRPGPRPNYGANASYFPLLFSLQVVAE